MKLDHAQTILNRINRMFDDVAEGGGTASSLERDLLKEYVRRLYESLSVENSTLSSVQVEESEAPKAKPQPPVAEIRRPKPAVNATPVVEEVQPEVSPPPANPKTIEIPASVEADIQEMEAQAAFRPAPVAVDNTATVMTASPAVEQITTSPFQRIAENLPAAVQAIFEVEKSNDLSAKLSGAPVKDLTRAMAINERLLAQNDLFGGSKAELDTTLTHLNTLASYEDAISYLGGGAAVKYDWAEGERKATARAFAKLVRRRYA